jgi:hypothetical protein
VSLVFGITRWSLAFSNSLSGAGSPFTKNDPETSSDGTSMTRGPPDAAANIAICSSRVRNRSFRR